MNRVNVKPLSVNEVWIGRHIKTKPYRSYEKEMLYTLRPIPIPEAPYEVYLKFGVILLYDIDNGVKPFLDILQKKYGFNDRYILRLVVEKEVVKSGNEFVEFEIKTLTK